MYKKQPKLFEMNLTEMKIEKKWKNCRVLLLFIIEVKKINDLRTEWP